MKAIFTLLLVLPMVLPGSSTFKGADDILGEWWIEDKTARVEIYRCDNGYCGKVTWLEYPNDKAGKPRIDKNNPDEKLRTRTLVGINLFEGFHYEAGEWVDGKIYNPQNGKHYSCILRMKDSRLEVRGYFGFTFIGKSTVWSRVERGRSAVKGE